MPVTNAVDGFAKQPAALEVRRIAGGHHRCGSGGGSSHRPASPVRLPGTNRLFIRPSAPAKLLAQDARQEKRIADDIAAPQPAGLDDQPEQPFEAQAAQPRRRARHRAAQEIEQRADRDRQRAMLARRDCARSRIPGAARPWRPAGYPAAAPRCDRGSPAPRSAVKIAVMDDHEPVLRRQLAEAWRPPARHLRGLRRAGRPSAGSQPHCRKAGMKSVPLRLAGKRLAVEDLRGDIDADAVRQDQEIGKRRGERGSSQATLALCALRKLDLGEAPLGDQAQQQPRSPVPQSTLATEMPRMSFQRGQAEAWRATSACSCRASCRRQTERDQAEPEPARRVRRAGGDRSARRRHRWLRHAAQLEARAANSLGSSATTQFAGTRPMPRSEREVATAGRPSSNVSMVFSCTPVPARLISGTTRPLRTNSVRVRNAADEADAGMRDARPAGTLPAIGCGNRAADAARPLPGTSRGRCGSAARSRCRSAPHRSRSVAALAAAAAPSRVTSGSAADLPRSADAERGAVFVGQREDEAAPCRRAAPRCPSAAAPRAGRGISAAGRGGLGVFLGRAELDIVRDEDRRLVVEQALRRRRRTAPR